MKTAYSANISRSKLRERWHELNPGNRINGVGADNNGEKVKYKTLFNKKKTSENVKHLLESV